MVAVVRASLFLSSFHPSPDPSVAYFTPQIFIFLNLNAVMSVIAEVPAALVSVVRFLNLHHL